VKQITTFLLALIAITSGVIVLAGYFIPLPQLVNLRVTFLNWAMLLTSVAVIVGVLNLLSIHFRNLRNKKTAFYSLILILFLFASFVTVIYFGPTHKASILVYSSIMLPVEASLMAMLAVSLLYATIRLLRWRADLMGIIFIITALIIFLGTAPLPFLGPIPIVSDVFRPIIAQVPAAAGARGILLGVALGTLMTGLRILLGADRPYGGS
jgi:hypothetical protein